MKAISSWASSGKLMRPFTFLDTLKGFQSTADLNRATTGLRAT